jgi:uncharacterized protein DUF5683
MARRNFTFSILFLLLLLPGTAIFAQQQDTSLIKNNEKIIKKEDTTLAKTTDTTVTEKHDTVILKSNLPDTSGKSLLATDTALKKFNPKTAMLRSAILPGWGQWYNKKYWKIPIIYGALGTTAYVFFYNLNTYKDLRNAVIYRSHRTHADSMKVAANLQFLTDQDLRLNRNVFRQNIDYSVLVFLGFWVLNVVDATVDAHLKAFDVSTDIGMRIKPGLSNMNNPGVSLVFFFKEKNSKPLLSLP